MFNLKDIIRPAFRAGLDPPISSSYIPKVVRPSRKISRNEPLGMRTQTFAADAPIPFIPPDFLRIKQLEAEKEGIKVQLGPGTLTKMLQVKIKDPNNDQIIITENKSIAELLQTHEGVLAGIRSILANLTADVKKSGKASQEDIAKLSLLIAKAYSKESVLTDAEAESVRVAQEMVPGLTLRAMGIRKNRITINDISDEYFAPFMKFMQDRHFMTDPRVSPEKPVYGLRGAPITVPTFRGLMRAGHTLDINRRLIIRQGAVGSVERMAEEEEKKEVKEEEFEDDEPDPAEEEEEESAGLAIGDGGMIPLSDAGNGDVSSSASGRGKGRLQRISVAEARRRARKHRKFKYK